MPGPAAVGEWELRGVRGQRFGFVWGWQGAPTASEGATEPIKEFISTEVADTPYKVCNPIPYIAIRVCGRKHEAAVW